MGTTFLKGNFHAPTHDEPSQDLLGLSIQAGAEKGGGFEFVFWITDQDPADGERIEAGRIPKIGARDDFDSFGFSPIPGNCQALPWGTKVTSD